MSLYDDGNPQHLEYRDRWRAIGETATQVLGMYDDELRVLRDCRVIRTTTIAAHKRYDALRSAGLARVIPTKDAAVHYALTEAGVAAANKLPVRP